MTEFISGRNGGQTDELGFTKPFFDLFRAGYTLGWNATQRGAGANMSVDVQLGGGNIEDTDRTFYGWTDAVKNVVVSTSNPSNPRKDILVAYEDKAVVSSALPNNPGALKFMVVAGTAAGSPVDPNGAAIQAAVGAGNPYMTLSRINVAAAASNIVNANIDDLRTPAALAMPYLYGGGSNTKGHLVPNIADDTLALLAAVQTLLNKTLTQPILDTPTIWGWKGWLTPNETWTYVSATSFKVTGVDVTAKYPVGTKLKLTQTTDKYFYVTSTSFSTDTTVNITAGSDYTLANATITIPSYSYEATPQGFPDWFNYTPTWTNLTVGSATQVFAFKMDGKAVTVRFSIVLSGSTMGTGPAFTFPVATSAAYLASQFLGTMYIEDAGVSSYMGHVLWGSTTTGVASVFDASSTYGRSGSITNAVPMAWGNGDLMRGLITYQAA